MTTEYLKGVVFAKKEGDKITIFDMPKSPDPGSGATLHSR